MGRLVVEPRLVTTSFESLDLGTDRSTKFVIFICIYYTTPTVLLGPIGDRLLVLAAQDFLFPQG
jgi:hypothetical protein